MWFAVNLLLFVHALTQFLYICVSVWQQYLVTWLNPSYIYIYIYVSLKNQFFKRQVLLLSGWQLLLWGKYYLSFLRLDYNSRDNGKKEKKNNSGNDNGVMWNTCLDFKCDVFISPRVIAVPFPLYSKYKTKI